MIKAVPAPGNTLLSPDNHVLMMIDHQSQMAFAAKSIDPVMLRNNTALVAHASAIFKIPTVLTTVAEKSFSGPMFDEIKEVYPDAEVIDRTTVNAWEDHRITDHINKYGKDKIIMAGLWTSVCVAGPALSAIDQDFEVYVIADACGDITEETHERAMERMIQRGIRPMTSMQYLLELQRDWARVGTYEAVTGLVKKLGGAYGIGIAYLKAIGGGH